MKRKPKPERARTIRRREAREGDYYVAGPALIRAMAEADSEGVPLSEIIDRLALQADTP